MKSGREEVGYGSVFLFLTYFIVCGELKFFIVFLSN